MDTTISPLVFSLRKQSDSPREDTARHSSTPGNAKAAGGVGLLEDQPCAATGAGADGEHPTFARHAATNLVTHALKRAAADGAFPQRCYQHGHTSAPAVPSGSPFTATERSSG